MDYNDEIHSDDWHTREIPDSPVCIKIISAKEANAKTIKALNDCATKELNKIMSGIHNTANEGYFTYGGDGYLNEITKKRLEELGYKVETGSQYNEPYYSISWEKANE